MFKLKWTLLMVSLIVFSTAGCTLSLLKTPAPLPTPTILVILTVTPLPPTPSPIPLTALPATNRPATSVPSVNITQVPPANFCADGQVTTLINNFKSALQASNGTLLSSLVSPVHGMDARYYRDGRVVNYDVEHAKFLFESTFVVDWGLAPGSGLPNKGSFHDVIVPALLDVFNKNYTLTCNQVQVGGTTYNAAWPSEYSGVNYYSIYFPGTQGNGSLDWHTWLIGVEYVGGKPYARALIQFQWEP